jgi:hypothetical protein
MSSSSYGTPTNQINFVGRHLISLAAVNEVAVWDPASERGKSAARKRSDQPTAHIPTGPRAVVPRPIALEMRRDDLRRQAKSVLP